MEVNFFSEDDLRKIDKNKLEIISRMLNDMQNKSGEERIQSLFSFSMEMRAKGLQFTKEESEILIEILKSNMSEREKAKMDMIAEMLKNMQ